MLRKIFLVPLVSLAMLGLFGCSFEDTSHLEPTNYDSVNTLDGVSLHLVEGSNYSVEPTNEDAPTPTSLSYYYYNTSEKELTYGQVFVIEEKINGKWFQVPTVIEDYGFEDIGYIIQPQSDVVLTTEWEWLYGRLEAGHYRLITEVLDVEELGSYDIYPLAIEFDIK